MTSEVQDSTRFGRARTRVLEKNTPEATLEFFRREGDQVGYDLAVDAVAAKYSIPRESIAPLLPGIRE